MPKSKSKRADREEGERLRGGPYDARARPSHESGQPTAPVVETPVPAPLPTEGHGGASTSSAGFGTRQPTRDPTESDPSNVDADLRYCQQQITKHYERTTSTIPVHNLKTSRRVDINEFFFQLQLAQRGNQRTQEQVTLGWKERILDRDEYIPLDSWEDFFRILQEGRRRIKVILSGGAGFGKSTILLRVANASTACPLPPPIDEFELVFLVELKKMQTSSCVLNAIFDQILPRDTQLTKPKLQTVIARHAAKTLFLLDGLDEMPRGILESPEGVYRVEDLLHGRVLAESFVLVTTRPHMVDYVVEKYPQYARVETLGFTPETASQYITKYFGQNQYSSAENLISNLKSQQSLQTLAQVPIITLLLCIVWKNQSRLPERLTALYEMFAEALVSRRCNEGENEKVLVHSVLRELGPVALDGLLDPRGERLVFSSEEFDKKALEDGCRLGFLQKEDCTSGTRVMQIVTFLHKSIQEYCAAYWFANLYHLDKEKFDEKLQQIHPGNVYAMKYLLRFTCGMSSVSPATGLILEHVQKQDKTKLEHNVQEVLRLLLLEYVRNDEDKPDEDEPDEDEPVEDEPDEDKPDEDEPKVSHELQELTRLLLFESNSPEMAARLDRPTFVSCGNQEQLIYLRYYLQNAPLSLDHTKFLFPCYSYEVLPPLRDILLDGNIKPAISQDEYFVFVYRSSERWNEELLHLEETLCRMDEALRDQMRLILNIGRWSRFDDKCGRLPYISNQVKGVQVDGRRIHDIANALVKCNKLRNLELFGFELRGQVRSLAHLIVPSLEVLSIADSDLNDDDVKDLVSILPAGRGLTDLAVGLLSCTMNGVENLITHLRGLPDLSDLALILRPDTGIDRNLAEQVAEESLPNVNVRIRIS